jgi:hypothetical protein
MLLQCFPVIPGKPMKVKVGFTLPLIPDGEQSVLVLPYIAERNFAYAEETRVALWAESNAPIRGGGEQRAVGGNGRTPSCGRRTR